MNKCAIISAFLGEVKNRYLQYRPGRTLAEKVEIARWIQGVEGLELCYPADFEDPAETGRMMNGAGLGVSAVNVRSRRTGKWLRGAFSSADPRERADVVDDFKKALDAARAIGVARISTCPLNDGHDYVFEMNYCDAYQYAEETFAAIAAYAPDVRVCIEYKINDPRTRCLLGTAGETLSFCRSVGAPNLGVTLDFGHSILAGERPAQAVALLHRAGKLFYVHLNDNDRQWDWDMLPGAYHVWETIEFLYYLKQVGYTGDWYGFDVMAKEVDTVHHFSTVVALTRTLEARAKRLDESTITRLAAERNPVSSMQYLVETMLGTRA